MIHEFIKSITFNFQTVLIRLPEGEVAGQTLAGIGFHVSRHAAQAVTSFERVLQLDPNLTQMPLPRALFWNHLALDLLAMGRTAEGATSSMRWARKKTPAFSRSWRHVRERRVARRGREVLAQSLSIDPNNADTLLDLGRLALGRGRFDEAIEMLERAAAFPRSRSIRFTTWAVLTA